MSYETMILTIDVDAFSDGRKVAERIEDQKFDSYGEFIKELDSELGSEADKRDESNVQLWTLTDFMDVCNDQEMNLENVWIGYVHIKKL